MEQRFISAKPVSSVPLSVRQVSSAYFLLTLALALTVAGVFFGIGFALPLLSSGWVFVLFIGEIALIFSARIWSKSYPLNYVLFAVFPLLSGLTLTPLIMSVLAGYVNGAAILLNAVITTTLLTGVAAVSTNFITRDIGSVAGRFMFNALIGLIIFGLLQLFVPGLRGPGMEMIVSAVGIVVFGMFLAYDIQRLRRGTAMGESPFLLALSLYLDIFNLFLYVLRFMLAVSGRRR
ncbi:hypothetical protein A3A67_03905 [Candidatus Peribacteria bacterium RIFCSPLOWO2_01_FULL_51_18]|nr:MAG: hypothetical protein A3C52_01595 [Candidatus Peribacteria bacterium RIFCSPHIGHO2_02_FULL_51_15]OGJ66769.1 MAG: hypothetical protein A3A67_03905 [Candidatus Peribacteria bacterium RIFCSPLOWO2_01_FULL_51_18]OGJ67213.1 MAG: hypothetical protein A3J34_02335 [Candidatus Peribacteria bacterium RIFCSPLOWO2_02_FULL_51_10]